MNIGIVGSAVKGAILTGNPESMSGSFGGQWTVDKLDILGSYLNAYTTALKNIPFKLMYIDAFAGTGEINPRLADDDARAFIDGSARLAIDVRDKPFDRLIFVEKDTQRHNQLVTLRQDHPDRDIRTENAEANSFLSNLQEDWRSWRGVLFLDPFATQVEWTTIKRIAGFNALDTWILCPISVIARLLPVSKYPGDVSEAWADRLNKIFGDDSWRELYHTRSQLSLFGDQGYERDSGTEGISKIYKDKLKDLFGQRFIETSKTLLNSKNSPLFEFMFCVGNESGIGPAKRIASHILNASA